MNLDYTDHAKTWAIAQELLTKSNEYAQARMDYAAAKFQFDIELARNLPVLRERKPNVGIETATIIILENMSNVREIYRNLLEKENYFKGLEKIIDALKSQITLTQSLIKHTQDSGG